MQCPWTNVIAIIMVQITLHPISRPSGERLDILRVLSLTKVLRLSWYILTVILLDREITGVYRIVQRLNDKFGPHDDVIKWKYFPRYWPFVREIHRSPVNFPHKGQWRGALMFTLICARKNGWVNNGEAGDLRRYLAHYDVIVMRIVHFIIKAWNATQSH